MTQNFFYYSYISSKWSLYSQTAPVLVRCGFTAAWNFGFSSGLQLIIFFFFINEYAENVQDEQFPRAWSGTYKLLLLFNQQSTT